MTREEAERLWNVATGGGKHSPATAFGGIAVARGAFKYIPIKDEDFTAGNNTAETAAAFRFLEEWAEALRQCPESSS